MHIIAHSDITAASLILARSLKRSNSNLRSWFILLPSTAAPKTPSADICSAGSVAAYGENNVSASTAEHSEFMISARRRNIGAVLANSIIIPARMTDGENPNSTASTGTVTSAIIACEYFPLPKSSMSIISTSVICAPETAVM
ncbi:unknown [Eubacterium sp. CAG:786]|nr:unknown [Eubacterium sp. CAG:786]